ncbi:MAG TPA: TlpA disulfide reductase family protein [Pyrinomonadaceae bacterium]|jgi:thiol-disulfide isomerase/thioredoxin
MPMRIGTELPPLNDATEWFNATQAHAESESKGHPTLVHFWAVSCGICKDNMPRVAEWREARREEGLRVIAVHMPRYEADTNIEDVREAISKYNITEPCAIDNMHKLRDAFKNDQGYVPAYYLFDGDGKLKSFAAGERGLDLLASALERVMAAEAQKQTLQTEATA